jgi:hypothetical protein
MRDFLAITSTLITEHSKFIILFYFVSQFILELVILMGKANGTIRLPPGAKLLQLTDFLYTKRKQEKVFEEIVRDMREEYFEAMAQNRIGKARWVRIRGTYSFFAAIGLDRAFTFVSFFIKAWKSVN